MLSRRLASVVVFCCILAGTHAEYPAAPGLVRDTAPTSQYTFDINAGFDLQSQTSEEAAPDLDFTTDGGVLYSMPYDYQRIGSDGASIWCTIA